MKSVVRLLLAGFAVSLMAGCASGVKHSEMAASLPTLKQGEGRVYFMRSASMFGAAIQPDIRLNGDVVGESKPGGFFFVDRPAGKYVASTSTETEKTISFALDAGETKYIRSYPTFGVVVGRVVLELTPPDQATTALADLSYTGVTMQVPKAK
ncbi:DUF2846 domain-containing protein [Cupriavidus plantarum]|uniref:Uncharacterized protein DUF2846 n=1 Tax=Cupriavidus plantarum TaxID=942865 RepID=A0A316F5K7_9BURK|nr:DUF2846 domain-containing protein [Cupriavidus plantarum]PWK38913.1 uncharacterized protein DUF2846 [Cupriavidus plantarum]CAG2150537.1 hypothetical protein LMG26296_04766 [Cupriavidus plantarum]SMR67910.1 Protein of unknown function [Cupriavidus plantarum]